MPDDCPSVNCTPPNDLEFYGTQGFAPQPLPPVNPPVWAFFNDAVYFSMCPTMVIRFSGSLPSWASIDNANHRMVANAGAFGGATKIAADNAAQSALNSFVVTNLNNGTLSCVPGLIILKDNEVTNVLSRFCENIKPVGGTVFFNSWGATGIFSSTDGVNWTKVFSTASGKFAYDTAYGAGMYVCPGNSIGGNGIVYTSPDGVTWTQRIAVAGFASTFWTAAYGAGVFVIAGDNNTVAWSSDGITWTNLGSIGTGGNLIVEVRFLNGVFYALNSSTGKMFTSPDGKVWTLSHTFTTPRDIAYGNGVYVVVENGKTWTSPDATTWTQHLFSGSPHLNGIAFGGGLFGVVTNTKKIFTSPDGFTWTDSGLTAVASLVAIAYFDGSFIACEG